MLIAVSQCVLQAADTTPTREYRLKAAFLFNFAGFAEWPASAFAQADAPLVIGVLGEDPFGSFLDDAVNGERANGHRLTVQRFHSVTEIQDCQILFISASESARLEAILAGLKGRNILTVGDIGSFAEHGGAVQFETENNKIRLKINLESAKDARVTLSSKLLRSAEIVNGKN